MSDGINKEIVLHCLKYASDFHDEICEECPMYSKCDHTWKSKVYERALELIENQWIPVKERVPIFTGYAVLAILENAYRQPYTYKQQVVVFYSDGSEEVEKCGERP